MIIVDGREVLAMNHARELGLRQPIARIAQSQVFEDVAATYFNLDRLFRRALCSSHHVPPRFR